MVISGYQGHSLLFGLMAQPWRKRMSGALLPLLQYASMAWCSMKKKEAQGQLNFY